MWFFIHTSLVTHPSKGHFHLKLIVYIHEQTNYVFLHARGEWMTSCNSGMRHPSTLIHYVIHMTNFTYDLWVFLSLSIGYVCILKSSMCVCARANTSMDYTCILLPHSKGGLFPITLLGRFDGLLIILPLLSSQSPSICTTFQDDQLTWRCLQWSGGP